MFTSLGELLGGLSLVLVGLWLLSENLRALTSRRIRQIVANGMPNRFVAWGWGAISGSFIQSSAGVTFIVIGLLRANVISWERAAAFVIGGNLGVGVLVLFVSLDMRLAAFYVLSVASLLIISERAVRFRALGAVLLGIALIFVGLDLIKESLALLAGQSAYSEFLSFVGGPFWVSFLGAAALCFLLQSVVAVIALVISLASFGILSNDQGVMAVYGCCMGSAITMITASFSLTGESRRLSLLQAGYNILLTVVFVPLLYIEIWTGTPLMRTLILSLPLDQPLSMALLMVDVFGTLSVILVLTPIASFYARFWPATSSEIMSRPVYIHSRNHGDITTALDLIGLEQRRVISAFSEYLDTVRQGGRIGSLQNSVRLLISEIDQFLTEARIRYPNHDIEGVNSMLARQRLLAWLEERFAELCDDLNRLPNDGTAGDLRDGLVEGLDALIQSIIDGLASGDPEDWSMVQRLTGDRPELMRQLRASYMSGQTQPGEAAQADILAATNTAAEIFSLFYRLTREIQNSRDLDLSPTRPQPVSPNGADRAQ